MNKRTISTGSTYADLVAVIGPSAISATLTYVDLGGDSINIDNDDGLSSFSFHPAISTSCRLVRLASLRERGPESTEDHSDL